MTRPFNESYLVRVWHDGGSWRARITHIGNGEHRFFTSLEQLWLFWQEETAVTPEAKYKEIKNVTKRTDES